MVARYCGGKKHRGPSLRKSERIKSERLLRRGRGGRDLDSSGQDCRLESDQPDERYAV